MPYAQITAARHGRRRTDARASLYPMYWQVVGADGHIIGAYEKTDFAQAMKDAAMLRTMCATVCDVRRAV